MVDAIHTDQLVQHGGLRGVRDENALESALARARNRFAHDASTDLAALAAAYAHGIARSHPFNDGNKRTAFMLAYVFLGLNRVELDSDEMDVVRAMLDSAGGALAEDELAEWIRKNSRRG